MQQKRHLIILYFQKYIEFVLLGEKSSTASVIASKKFRLYKRGYDFSPANYILKTLTLWQKEIGLTLVSEMVPIIPQDGKKGISDIYIFAYKDCKDLRMISKKYYIFTNEIQRSGAKIIAKLLNFENILSVSLDDDNTVVTRYKKGKGGVMKVVSESKRFVQRRYNSLRFLSKFGEFNELLNFKEIQNYLANSEILPPFAVYSFKEVLLEFLIAVARLKTFLKCKKLDLASFGRGDFADNLLILGGERLKVFDNFACFFLSVSTAFDLKGNFGIYNDSYGIFDFLQRGDGKVFKEKFLKALLVKLWGNYMRVQMHRKVKFDQVVADVDVVDGGGGKQVIPMVGKIHKISLSKPGDIRVKLKENFSTNARQKSLNLKNIVGNFVFDGRVSPMDKNFELSKAPELLRSWIVGVEAINVTDEDS